jgi:hypothetical protein
VSSDEPGEVPKSLGIRKANGESYLIPVHKPGEVPKLQLRSILVSHSGCCPSCLSIKISNHLCRKHLSSLIFKVKKLFSERNEMSQISKFVQLEDLDKITKNALWNFCTSGTTHSNSENIAYD